MVASGLGGGGMCPFCPPLGSGTVDDIYILRNKNAQKPAYGIPLAELAVYLTYKGRH